MIKVCAGSADRLRHLWVEVYVRLPRQRTLIVMWTRGMWRYATVTPEPFRRVTAGL